MKSIGLFCSFAVLAAFTSGVELECSYLMSYWSGIGGFYTCDAKLVYAENPTTVTAISGTHMAGKYNTDVRGFTVGGDRMLTKIPNGIEHFFVNLEGIYWYNGSISTIDSSLLEPFPSLLFAYLNGNKLVKLDGDLFSHTRKLRWIRFDSNLLQHVGHDLLTGLTNLTTARFDSNPCIDIDARTPELIFQLNRQLPIQCPPLVTPPDPPTTSITPTEPPILSSCYAISHLFDVENGFYMKSYCIIDRMVDYEQAEVACRDRNMNLFVIENSSVQSAFFTATTSDLISHSYGFIWINGRKEINDEWFTFNPSRVPLYSGIDWVQTGTIDGRVSGDCLRYSSEHGHYQAKGAPCNSQSWCTCEFLDSSSTTPDPPTTTTSEPNDCPCTSPERTQQVKSRVEKLEMKMKEIRMISKI